MNAYPLKSTRMDRCHPRNAGRSSETIPAHAPVNRSPDGAGLPRLQDTPTSTHPRETLIEDQAASVSRIRIISVLALVLIIAALAWID